MSLFYDVQTGPGKYTQAFGLTKKFVEDTSPNKVNLAPGVYRTDEGKPWVLPVVRKAEKLLAEDETLDKEYLPVLGLDKFCKVATELLLGAGNKALAEGRVISAQTLSGTGALRVAGDFLVRVLNATTIYISTPTWENHELVFLHSCFKEQRFYRYWNAEKRCIDFDGLKEDLENARPYSVIVLHACAHNPTGSDPTKEQWAEIANIMKKRNLFPLFDSAYQGFASGDPDKDAWAMRYFVEQGMELICCQSFAKNFGLYNERIGNMVIVVNDPKVASPVKSQLLLIKRGMYSSPPNHGAQIVSTVLSNPSLFAEWKECIKIMSGRIEKMRKALRQKLEELNTPGSWSHITTQIGMFSYTGLTPIQCEYMVNECHVYMMDSGRVSMTGMSSRNVDYVAKSMHNAVLKFPN